MDKIKKHVCEKRRRQDSLRKERDGRMSMEHDERERILIFFLLIKSNKKKENNS
jgi:hypothetical protein